MPGPGFMRWNSGRAAVVTQVGFAGPARTVFLRVALPCSSAWSVCQWHRHMAILVGFDADDSRARTTVCACHGSVHCYPSRMAHWSAEWTRLRYGSELGSYWITARKGCRHRLGQLEAWPTDHSEGVSASQSMKDVMLDRREQVGLQVPNAVLEYQLRIARAVEVLGLSERDARCSLAAYPKECAAALAHVDRGRRPPCA